MYVYILKTCVVNSLGLHYSIFPPYYAKPIHALNLPFVVFYYTFKGAMHSFQLNLFCADITCKMFINTC